MNTLLVQGALWIECEDCKYWTKETDDACRCFECAHPFGSAVLDHLKPARYEFVHEIPGYSPLNTSRTHIAQGYIAKREKEDAEGKTSRLIELRRRTENRFMAEWMIDGWDWPFEKVSA